MEAKYVFEADRVRKLPPLILHPFSDGGAPARVTLSARASLILRGLLPGAGFSETELNEQLIEGRYCEIRMLYYIGKDLCRWVEQCMEFVAQEEALSGASIEPESFICLLVEDPPEPVAEKLRNWGVADFRAIFRRALGLHTVFASIPPCELLGSDFIRLHHRYTDALYACRVESGFFARLRSADFPFDLYASGEYAQKLASEWEKQQEPPLL